MAKAQPAAFPARYYAIFVDRLRRLGVDVDALLRSARIAPGALYGADGLLTLPQVDALVEGATERTRTAGPRLRRRPPHQAELA